MRPADPAGPAGVEADATAHVTLDDDFAAVSGSGLTALSIAAGRAIETNHRDGLIDDPFAEHFVRAAADQVALPTRIEQVEAGDLDVAWGRGARYVGLRTRFFDDCLVQSADAGIDQFVLLAAGLDTRAFRLGLPGRCELYEIDHAPVLAFKQRVLDGLGVRPEVRRHTIAADLAGAWQQRLLAAGFDPARPTAWLAEGLLVYLSPDTEARLLATAVDLSAPGSRIGLEIVLGHTTDDVRRDPLFAQGRDKLGVAMGKLFSTQERRDPVTWLTSQGWEVTGGSAFPLQARYGRGPGDDNGDIFSQMRLYIGSTGTTH